MIELYYTPIGIAYYLDSRNIGARVQMELLERIYVQDELFLHPAYRQNKRKFFQDVLYWVNYLMDGEELDSEYPAIAADFRRLGRQFPGNDIEGEFQDVDLFFMHMRLQIRFGGGQDYIRMKLRTLLHHYGYKQRSAKLMAHVRDCLWFYHIQSSYRGTDCDVRDVNIDTMVTFRLV